MRKLLIYTTLELTFVIDCLSKRGWCPNFKSQQGSCGHELSCNRPLPRPHLQSFSDVCYMRHVQGHKIRASRGWKAQKGLFFGERDSLTIRITLLNVTRWLRSISLCFIHVKLSMTLTVCLKIIYSVSSYSMNSVVLLKDTCNPVRFRAVFHSSPPPCAMRISRSQQKNQGARSQKLLNAWRYNNRKRC